MDVDKWFLSFHSRIDKDSPDHPFGCWIWTSSVDVGGYGIVSVPAHLDHDVLRSNRTRSYRVHRLVHQMWIGPIPDGMHVDHVCHSNSTCVSGTEGCIHRRCCNPSHLEAVSPRANAQRSVRNSGSPRYGYKRTQEGTVILPEEYAVLQRIHTMREQGESLNGIARVLNGEGIPPKRGKLWYAGTIMRIVDPEARSRHLATQHKARRRHELGDRSEWLD